MKISRCRMIPIGVMPIQGTGSYLVETPNGKNRPPIQNNLAMVAMTAPMCMDLLTKQDCPQSRWRLYKIDVTRA